MLTRMWGFYDILLIISTFTIVLTSSILSNIQKKDNGCQDGTVEGLGRHHWISACAGSWEGHIQNSSHLCAPGWRVCSWVDKDQLKAISWLEAISVDGCYAINAAQDNGLCQPCRNDLEQDDLAGIGRGCPHQNYGQSSCITGGRIDVSCCVDTHFLQACIYRPGLATGVLCCKLPGQSPQIKVPPQEKVFASAGRMFTLICQAAGSPTPRINWYKNNILIPSTIDRIDVTNQGEIIVDNAEVSDSGHYTCVASNFLGNATAEADLVVAEQVSGCADNTVEGLFFLPNISACAGQWTGHVRRAKHLCSKGWRVCNANDQIIHGISWAHAVGLDGCYAYNAANIDGKCKRCHNKGLAGVGRLCSLYHKHGTSCLHEGRIDVYEKNKEISGCLYKSGLTTGVLCCSMNNRKTKESLHYHPLYHHHKHTKIVTNEEPVCTPSCQNGGTCTSHNKCQCLFGYKGLQCQYAICVPICGPNAICVTPGKCQCAPGYSGPKCEHPKCVVPCYNGGRCRNGKCYCNKHHWGSYCQYVRPKISFNHINNTER